MLLLASNEVLAALILLPMTCKSPSFSAALPLAMMDKVVPALMVLCLAVWLA
ncbi:hypothetical protein D3C78_1760920 [compost metagenome]